MTKGAQQATLIHPATPDKITLAGDILAQGGLVAIPTETVYGLTANALDKYAVARIFETKGRAFGKPLIIFVSDLAGAKKLAEFTPLAARLAEEFWPGALTLVLKRREGCPLPEILTAGRDSIAIRIPKNPVARALLKTSHLPLAVTSANPSGGISPTTAKGVAEALPGALDLILDGGAAELGRESTVLDVRADPPVLVREGATSRQVLEDFIGTRIERPGP